MNGILYLKRKEAVLRIECSETAVLRIERVETAAESRPNELCRKAAEELEEYISEKGLGGACRDSLRRDAILRRDRRSARRKAFLTGGRRREPEKPDPDPDPLPPRRRRRRRAHRFCGRAGSESGAPCAGKARFRRDKPTTAIKQKELGQPKPAVPFLFAKP